MNIIQSLRGTKDAIGPEARAWEALEAAARGVFERFGYEPMRTPLLEENALFSRSVGEDTDIVQKEMYRFEDRSGAEVALRPEGTASVVRALVEHHLQKERPVNKFYYYGPMFRAERPQAGRLRQFHQIGAELFGSSSETADAEAIELLVRVLEAAGVTGYSIELNNLGSSADRKAFSHGLVDYLKKHVPSLCGDCRHRTEKNPFRVLDCKEPQCQPVIEKAPRISDAVSPESKARFARVKALLGRAGIGFRENPRIVRGLDYYTDTVFEVKHPALGSQDAIGAGGRYDRLVETLGGDPTPAVGFALGCERMLIATAKTINRPAAASSCDIAVIYLGEEAQALAYEIASKLRSEGRKAGMDLTGRSMKAQLRQANEWGVRLAVIIGEDELKKGEVTVKDMRPGGEQKAVPADRILAVIKGYLDA